MHAFHFILYNQIFQETYPEMDCGTACLCLHGIFIGLVAACWRNRVEILQTLCGNFNNLINGTIIAFAFHNVPKLNE